MLEARNDISISSDARERLVTEAFTAGRRSGLAIASLALSVVSFISLLGAEKAILAIVLAVAAIRGSQPGMPSRRLALAAICIGLLFIATVVVVLTVYWDKVAEFITLLEKMS